MSGIYLLNKITVYDSKLACIYNINEPQIIYNITTPANLCLLMLINQRDEVIPQRSFFREVWEKHNMAVSANTFYQNISIIRKAFRKAGLENVVITIPRRGLRLSSDIVVEPDISLDKIATQSVELSDKSLSEINATEDNKLYTPEPKINEESHLEPNLTHKSVVFSPLWIVKLFQQHSKSLFFALLAVLITAFYFLVYTSESSKEFFSDYRAIQDINGCSVYILDKNYEYANKIVEETLVREAIRCEKEEVVYFSALKGLPRMSIVQCSQLLSSNPQASCSSTYLVGY